MLSAGSFARGASVARHKPYLPNYNARSNSFEVHHPKSSRLASRLNVLNMRRTVRNLLIIQHPSLMRLLQIVSPPSYPTRTEFPKNASLIERLNWCKRNEDVTSAVKV